MPKALNPKPKIVKLIKSMTKGLVDPLVGAIHGATVAWHMPIPEILGFQDPMEGALVI